MMTTELLSRATNGASPVPSRSIPSGATVKHHPVFGQIQAGGMYGKVVRITPEMAAQLLTMQVRQRPLSKTTVEDYAADMADGEFVTIHQGIAITPEGKVNDGQHRLHGVVKSGVAIDFFVVFNSPESTFGKIDRQRRRSGADYTAMKGHGVGNRFTLSAAARFLYQFDLGFPLGYGGSRKDVKVKDSHLDAAIAAHPLIHDTVEWVEANVKGSLATSRSVFAAMLVLFREIDDAKAMALAPGVASGVGLAADDPAYALREYLLRNQMSSRDDKRAAVAAWIRAWNAHYKGKRLQKVMTVTRNGEPLPEFLGR